jgi:hypothetical protein
VGGKTRCNSVCQPFPTIGAQRELPFVFGRRTATELHPIVGDHGLNFWNVLSFEDIKDFQGSKHHTKDLFVFYHFYSGRAAVTVNQTGQMIRVPGMIGSDAFRQLLVVNMH